MTDWEGDKNPDDRESTDYPAADTRWQEAAPASSGVDRGQVGVAILVVLAVVASIIMLISGSQAALKLALIAALWAAVLGFFLVTRYRRDVAERTLELELREEAFSTELARVQAERDAQPGSAQSAPADLDLAEIKEQLAAIRRQLEDLAGREFTYEPAALRAEARRIAEIEAATGHAAGLGGDDVEPEVNFSQTSTGAPSADAIAGRLGAEPTAPLRHDNPLAALIQEREAARDAEAPAAHYAAAGTTSEPADAAPAATASQPAAKAEPPESAKPTEPTEPTGATKATRPASAPESGTAKAPRDTRRAGQQTSPESTFSTGSFQAVRWDQGGLDETARAAEAVRAGKALRVDFDPASPQEADTSAAGSATGDAPAAAHDGVDSQPQRDAERSAEHASHHGRRRSDAGRDGAVSVAELMAAMKKNRSEDK